MTAVNASVLLAQLSILHRWQKIEAFWHETCTEPLCCQHGQSQQDNSTHSKGKIMNRIFTSSSSVVFLFAGIGIQQNAAADVQEHLHSLAAKIERQANLLITETRHYRHSLHYAEMLADVAKFRNIASHLHHTTYTRIELMCWPIGKAERRYAGVTHLDVVNCDEAAIDQMASLTDRYGVAVSGLGYYPNPLSADSEESAQAIRHLEDVIKAASRLGICKW